MKIKYLEGTHSDFSRDLDAQVAAYFKRTGKAQHGNAEMYAVILLFLLLYFGSYALLLANVLPGWAMILAVVVMGLSYPSIFLNIAHDASHNCLVGSTKWNRRLVHLLDLIGMNGYIFDYLHNRVHHVLTSIEGADIVVEEFGIIRLSKNQPYQKVHRNQLWYAPFLYLLFGINLILSVDFVLFKRERMGNIEPVEHPKGAVGKAILFKLLYFGYALVLPLVLIDAAWWQIVLGFLAMQLIGGFIFACVGVLNHQIAESVFPEVDDEGYIHNSKKNHELLVTIDFAPKSKLASYLFGGFNTHVAHHLYPTICHCHYGPITQMIKDTAPKYGLEYKSKSFTGAIASHLRYLQDLSVDPEEKAPAAMAGA